jgi:fucose permease
MQAYRIAGAALSPLMVGLIADMYSLEDAFIIICVSTWLICALFFITTAIRIPKDILNLRNQMRIRAETERKIQFSINNEVK